jgi:dTDP-4-dehydrorhamnose reductase
MKILITGANGYVGKGLMQYLPREGNILIPSGLGVDEKPDGVCSLDLTDFAATNLYLRSIQPDLILHLAGNKDVSKCESDKALSRKVNYEASKNIVRECSLQKIRLVYLSTDYVFSGKGAPFNELSRPSPTTQYGKDKLATEDLIKEELADYAIVRTAGIFGLKNDFVETVIKQMKMKDKFKAYTNLKNTPTFIKDLASMLNIIIGQRRRGTFHCAGSESVSRHDFALKIAKILQLEQASISPENIDFSHDPRPSDLSMDSSRTYKILNYHPQGIEKILQTNRNIWR